MQTLLRVSLQAPIGYRAVVTMQFSLHEQRIAITISAKCRQIKRAENQQEN